MAKPRVKIPLLVFVSEIIRIPRNAVTSLPALCQKNIAFIIPEIQEPNLVPMLQSWETIKCQPKGNMDGKIELYSPKSLRNPRFMVHTFVALVKQS